MVFCLPFFHIVQVVCESGFNGRSFTTFTLAEDSFSGYFRLALSNNCTTGKVPPSPHCEVEGKPNKHMYYYMEALDDSSSLCPLKGKVHTTAAVGKFMQLTLEWEVVPCWKTSVFAAAELVCPLVLAVAIIAPPPPTSSHLNHQQCSLPRGGTVGSNTADPPRTCLFQGTGLMNKTLPQNWPGPMTSVSVAKGHQCAAHGQGTAESRNEAYVCRGPNLRPVRTPKF